MIWQLSRKFTLSFCFLGIIRTPIHSLLGLTESNEKEYFDSLMQEQLVDRIGETWDIANGMEYLASQTFVNGTQLSVDGGWVCKH